VKCLLEDELIGLRDVRIIVAIDDLDRTVTAHVSG
jgi:hypothetical protein